jgi:hypothetical protein
MSLNAYLQGCVAYLKGESFYDNPFELDQPTTFTRRWIDGYVAAIISEANALKNQ